jgi:uncharacterized protein YkwD
MKLGPLILVVGSMVCAELLPAKDLMALSAREFAGQPGLTARLNPADLDRALLAAAIFHETNRVRDRFNLRPFKFLAKLNDAADVQASVGGAIRPPSHTNPFLLIATPIDRVKYAGLDPLYVAENIALISLLDVRPGHGVGLVRHDGEAVFIDLASGERLNPHTYAGFAAAVVQAWMDSPGHRANILSPKVRYLGCSVQATRGDHGMDMIFSVQVFYTPHRRRPLGQIPRTHAPSEEIDSRRAFR